MKKYFIRAAKYFIYLTAMWALVLSIMFATGYVNVDVSSLSELMKSTNVYVLIVVVLAFSGLYPKYGYINKQVPRINNKQKLEEELYRIGIIKVKEEGNKTYYRYKSTSRRLLVRFEDMIIIEYRDDCAIIDSNRVMASRIWPKIEYVTLN